MPGIRIYHGWRQTWTQAHVPLGEVLPIPCPSSVVLLGNATWAKEAPIPFLPESSVQGTQHNTWPQGSQDCVSKVRLQVRDPGHPKQGLSRRSIHPPVPSGCTPTPDPPGTLGSTEWGTLRLPASLVCGGTVPASQQAGPQHIHHMQW